MHSLRKEDEIRTIRQLSQHQMPINKVTTLGVIVDCTSVYDDQYRKGYARKINIIDPTFNVQHYSPLEKSTYLSVFFQSHSHEKLPNPLMLGDIIYIKRFKFNRYNEQLQAFYQDQHFCSYALFHGDIQNQSINAYQSSKGEIRFKQVQLQILPSKLSQLRKFAREFLSKTSVLALHPYMMKTKDTDYIVKVIEKSQNGYILNHGQEQLLVQYFPSAVQEGSIAKLRSIIKIEKRGKLNKGVCSKYTSLMGIGNYSYDAKIFYHFYEELKSKQIDIYTTLKKLNQLPNIQCQNMQFNVKVQIAQITPKTFIQAVQYYQKQFDRLLPNKPSAQLIHLFGSFYPVYRMIFVCIDWKSKETDQFTQIFLFSDDHKGSDLLPRVQLDDLNQFTSYVQENHFYKKKLQQLLNAEYVNMVVEVLFDDNAIKRVIRVVKIVEIVF